MSTVASNGGTILAPIFQYGPVAGPFVAADPASSYSADGTITIIVPTSGIGNPQPGQTISGFLTRIAATVVAVSITPDNMPDNLGPAGSYTLVGNASCAPNAAPIAALAGAPLTGTAPVQVNFDASASLDPDSGDTIASYTFNFGDGSPEVTQASPMISHTYTDSGAFQASVRVTDSRGASSTNPTSVVVQVGSTLTGVVSRKTHGAAGDFDIALPGVECRNAADNSHLLVFTFQRNLTAVTSSTVSEGTATKGSEGIGPAQNQYFVTLTGVANAQYMTVTLDGVQDTAGTNLTGVNGRMAILNGDVTANLVTNSSDVAQAKAQSGQTTDAGNFRLDVNANGMVNSSDVSQIKANSGTSVSAPARGSANASRK